MRNRRIIEKEAGGNYECKLSENLLWLILETNLDIRDLLASPTLQKDYGKARDLLNPME